MTVNNTLIIGTNFKKTIQNIYRAMEQQLVVQWEPID